jgi:hypothetical protein
VFLETVANGLPIRCSFFAIQTTEMLVDDIFSFVLDGLIFSSSHLVSLHFERHKFEITEPAESLLKSVEVLRFEGMSSIFHLIMNLRLQVFLGQTRKAYF